MIVEKVLNNNVVVSIDPTLLFKTFSTIIHLLLTYGTKNIC